MLSSLHNEYPSLYGKGFGQEEMDSRFLSLISRHKEEFGKACPMIFSAAGRTEIAGNHTDHNLGKAIGGTINLDTIAAVSKRKDSRVILISEGFPVTDVDISDTEAKDHERNTTASLIRGIARAFKDRGIEVSGWEANTSSRVLRGSGLSSSAAIEVLCCEIFNSLYAEDRLTPLDMAMIGQYAENLYFGKPSGLLDQICCASGGITSIDFSNTACPAITPLSISFSDFGYTMVITDTKGSHADLTAEYASIPSEMRAVAGYFGKSNLGETDFASFIAGITDIRKKLGNDRALLRAYHFYTENERISRIEDALRSHDLSSFLEAVKESGNSSFRFLQNVYPSSDPRCQGLSIGIALSEHILNGQGAVRVHGGGFAGTIQAYVPEDSADSYIQEMDRIFGRGAATRIEIRSLPVCRIL